VPTFKVFVGNIPFATTEEDLIAKFGDVGKVLKASVVKRGQRSMGYAFVDFATDAEAQAATASHHKSDLGGRTINVEAASPRGPRPEGERRPRTRGPPRAPREPRELQEGEEPRRPRERPNRRPREAADGAAALTPPTTGADGQADATEERRPSARRGGARRPRSYGPREDGGADAAGQPQPQDGEERPPRGPRRPRGPRGPRAAPTDETVAAADRTAAPAPTGDDLPRADRPPRRPRGPRQPRAEGGNGVPAATAAEGAGNSAPAERTTLPRRRQADEDDQQQQQSRPPRERRPRPPRADVPEGEERPRRDRPPRRPRQPRVGGGEDEQLSKKMLFVANLSYSVDDAALADAFSKISIQSARVVRDYGGRSKGFAFIECTDEAAQQKALQELDQTEVNGRPIAVRPGRISSERGPIQPATA
jgi:RNA recognition motif-containing protein